MVKALCLLFSLTFGLCFSQVNIDEIKKNVAADPQKYYYDYLEIFKRSPERLEQEQLNYIYYGNNYVDYGYNENEFYQQLKEVQKFSGRTVSKKLAGIILEKALPLYEQNPLHKDLLLQLSSLYHILGDQEKGEKLSLSYQLLTETIRKSGTGKLDTSPIVVTSFSDHRLILQEQAFMYRPDFNIKILPDGSWLTVVKSGLDLYFIKMLHYKDRFKDDK